MLWNFISCLVQGRNLLPSPLLVQHEAFIEILAATLSETSYGCNILKDTGQTLPIVKVFMYADWVLQLLGTIIPTVDLTANVSTVMFEVGVDCVTFQARGLCCCWSIICSKNWSLIKRASWPWFPTSFNSPLLSKVTINLLSGDWKRQYLAFKMPSSLHACQIMHVWNTAVCFQINPGRSKVGIQTAFLFSPSLFSCMHMRVMWRLRVVLDLHFDINWLGLQFQHWCTISAHLFLSKNMQKHL